MLTEYFNPEVTIASGTTTEMISLNGATLVGIFIPAGIASSSMKILNAEDPNDTPVELYLPDTRYGGVGDYSMSIAASKYVAFPPELAAGLMNIKLEFDSSETSKTYTLITREIT